MSEHRQAPQLPTASLPAQRFSPPVGLSFAVLILLAVGVFAALNLRSLMRTRHWAADAQTTLQKIEETISLLQDAQNAERGYVITGNERYLEPYNAALASNGGLAERLQELRDLIRDDSSQQRRLEQLQPFLQSELDFVRHVVELRRNVGFDSAQHAVQSGQGKKAMDSIRVLIAEMKTAEGETLRQRSVAASTSARNTALVMAAGGVCSVLLLFFTFRLVHREVSERRRAEQATLELNRELDARVQRRTEELATASHQIERQLDQLKSLRAIDLAILGTTDLQLVLRTILAEIRARLAVDAATVFLFDPHALTLDIAASSGWRSQAAERITMRLGDGVTGKAALERRTIAVPIVSDATVARSETVKAVTSDEDVKSLYAIPLIAKGQLIGVLTLGFRAPFAADFKWLEFAEALAGQAAMAVESVQSFSDLQRSNTHLALAYDTTIEGWARALDLRDKETEGHSRRVTEMTVQLASMAGIPKPELVHIRRGALLHDIGKMGVPDAILLKPGKLSDEEWVVMRQHPVYAYELLSPIAHLGPALDIPYCHHEKWDGSGYPRGLKGDQIPLAARLFAIVDIWDALRSDRPYRPAWPIENVRAHIADQSGTHFDPAVVTLFLRLVEKFAASEPVNAEAEVLMPL